ncbi:MAG: hypothetical protein QNJ65_04845 [Xenococcaceae cyanobacterium MO_234.B1]|nr:hypothetical protein [Xenococcaceae cyanobacterium MO_234.B1]
MPFKPMQGLCTGIVLVKSLFFIAIVHAQVLDSRPLSPANLTSITQTDNQSSKLFATQDPSESGSPSLRRQPLEGEEKFEPKRIPLRIPRQNYYRVSPSVTIINPSGYGAAWGNAGIGIGFQERARFVDKSDAVIGFGFGLGNPQKSLGVQIGVSLVDVSSPYRDGAVSIKVHRRLPEDFSIAVGTQGAKTWGDTDGGSSVYGVVTRRFRLKPDRTKPLSEMYVSFGIGGGQFRSASDIENGVESIGGFGSFAVRVIEPVSFITEWTGQDLTIGTSIVPFKSLPIVIIPAITDITGQAGDGTRFIFGAGYSFSF